MTKIKEIVKNLEKLAVIETRSQDVRDLMATLIPKMLAPVEDRELSNEDIKTLNTIIGLGKALADISNKAQRIDPKLSNIVDTIGKALQGT
jgi:hypothetical protein